MKDFEKCTHCHETIKDIRIESNDALFCCYGCETVFKIIHDNKLENYYSIREQEQDYRTPFFKNKNYDYLDDLFRIDDSKELQHIELAVTGIHCMACLWLLEKSSEYVPGIHNARVNLENETINLTIDTEKNKLSNIAREISKLGYELSPLDEETNNKKNQFNRKEILRIGIAGAALGNIMIYAVSNYAGAKDLYADIFNLISLILCLPIVLYCSIPFYKSALTNIKLRILSIDLPLSIAIVLGFILSLYNHFMGNDHLYYDSISALVFLILLSRYLVKIFTNKAINSDLGKESNEHILINIINNGIVKEKYINKVEVGEIIRQYPGESLFFDGIQKGEKCYLDNSIITGESRPMETLANDEVFAGAKVIDNEIDYIVTQKIGSTRISKLIKEINILNTSRSKSVLMADKISQLFISFVLLLTVSTFCYWIYRADSTRAINTALALIIVSCPCALALATPLSFIRALKKLQDNEVYIKNEETLEKIKNVKNIILDKTGTLTNGKFKLIKTINENSLYNSITYTLERKSNHPIAYSLREALKSKTDSCIVNNIREEKGEGIYGNIGDIEYFLGKVKKEDLNQNYLHYTQVGLYMDDQLLTLYILGDELKPQSYHLIKNLKEHCHVYICSGDNRDVVVATANQLNVNSENTLFKQTPESKADLVASLDNTIMIGDGINDSLALKKADIGVSVGGAVNLALNSSDVYLTTPDLNKIITLLEVAKETDNITKRNIIFSLSYNIIGITLATMGLITPLAAAILMPISSLTVVLSTLIGRIDFKQQMILKHYHNRENI